MSCLNKGIMLCRANAAARWAQVMSKWREIPVAMARNTLRAPQHLCLDSEPFLMLDNEYDSTRFYVFVPCNASSVKYLSWWKQGSCSEGILSSFYTPQLFSCIFFSSPVIFGLVAPSSPGRFDPLLRIFIVIQYFVCWVFFPIVYIYSPSQ